MELLLEADEDGTSSVPATLPPLPGTSTRLRMQQTSWDDAGTGGSVWPAASVLCRWMAKQTGMRGATVLEIGCGTGAVGLFAAALGASRVVLTDVSDGALENAQRNISVNRSLFGDTDVSTRKLAFGDVSEKDKGHLMACIKWKWIFASDCVYGSENAKLFQTIRGLLSTQHQPPPRVILSIPHRHPGPLLSASLLASAPGLKLQVVECERAPAHDGGSRKDVEQTVAVSVVEARLDSR